jgi:urease alpha subunit
MHAHTLQQPVLMRPMYGALGKAVGLGSVAWVSKACVAAKTAAGYGLTKRIESVQKCRGIGKKDMQLNDATPNIKVRTLVYFYIVVYVQIMLASMVYCVRSCPVLSETARV